MNSLEVAPNYVNLQSAEVENQLKSIIEKSIELGFNVKRETIARDEVLNVVAELLPERYKLVTDKLALEGLSLDQLDDEVLCDRLLGIDALININGKRIAIDVTSGNGTLLYNKRKKFEELQTVFNRLGISHAGVVSIKGSITDDQIISMFDTFSNLDDNAFCTVLKYRNQQIENN